MNDIRIREYDYVVLKRLSHITRKPIHQLVSEIVADKISVKIDRELAKLHKQNSY